MNAVRLLSVVVVLLAVVSPVWAQSPGLMSVWLFFDAKDESMVTGDPILDAPRLGITDRALRRRAKVLPVEQILDHRDLPVRREYVRRLEAAGLKIRATSRWMNAVSVEASQELIDRATDLAFVRHVEPVHRIQRPPVTLSPVPPGPSLSKQGSLVNLDYGQSGVQLSNIRVVDVHNLGINGSGVVVGMIDNGFNNHRSHRALRDITIIDEFDFIHRIVSTQRQPWEGFSQGNHGALTLSALGGFESGRLIGAAYGSSLILAKTEMDSAEVPAEEDLYVEALEWMEQLGADVVSTSLGYIDWYTYDSLNGTTAITSKAARVAASKGVLLVTAMGNEGHFRGPGLTGTMIAPADADSIVSAGATFSDGEIASFSSTGPTFDGRVKPEVVAQGVGVVSADGSSISGYVSASGTSLSTPLVAGAAALVLSAQPQLTPMQVREALMKTARPINDRFDPSRTAVYPNNFYGHGMVDAFRALTHHGIAMINRPLAIDTAGMLHIYVSALSDTSLILDSLAVFYQSGPGQPFQRAPLVPASLGHWYTASVPQSSDTAYPRGYVLARDAKGRTRTSPSNAPSTLYAFRQFVVSSIPGITPTVSSFALKPNFPNPFNGETTIIFESPDDSFVELFIYDLLGRRVRTLFAGRAVSGTNSVRWDGRSSDGNRVSSGVYFYQLRTPQAALARTLLFLQ